MSGVLRLEWTEDHRNMFRATAGFVHLRVWCSAPGWACWEIVTHHSDRWIDRGTGLTDVLHAQMACEERVVELLNEAIGVIDP